MQITRQVSGIYVSELQIYIHFGLVKCKPVESPKEPHVLVVKKAWQNALYRVYKRSATLEFLKNSTLYSHLSEPLFTCDLFTFQFKF